MIGLKSISLVKGALVLVALVMLLLFTVIPFIWLAVTSLKSWAEMWSPVPIWIPKHPTLMHYKAVFTSTKIVRYLINSLVVATATTVITLLCGVLAGYSLARLKFPGREPLGLSILLFRLVPQVVVLLPLFLLMIRLHILDTYWALIIPHTAFAIPFCVWLLRGYFAALPAELEEAAMIDGCTRLSALLKVILPLTAPGIAAAGILAFTFSWNEFIFALVLTQSEEMRTVPVGIALLFGKETVNWGMVTATSTLVALPVVFAFIFVQKYMVRGLAAGAVKE